MAVERRLMTAEELLRLPDDGMRHELIDGELRSMAPAGGEHGGAGWDLAVELGFFIKERRLGRGFLAETGFVVGRDPDRVRAPDFAFIAAERLPDGRLPKGYITIAPDLVLEVVSPGDTAGEVRAKVQDWLDFGCRGVWVLYEEPRLDVFTADAVRTYGPDDEVDGGDALPGFRRRLRDLVGPTRR